ncbi:hypothetical protein [Leptospira alexanderi]|nr:hypothetical protein [Leptospira alexanderi]
MSANSANASLRIDVLGSEITVDSEALPSDHRSEVELVEGS